MSTSDNDVSAKLLDWYVSHRRRLPWRALPGKRADPYRVWLSEIMLQQTTVAAVVGYFAAFLRRWPSIEALAAAPLDEILHAWQGLGYYARARNLHRCAQVIVRLHGGKFPEDQAALRGLPGIGPYTAAAIAAIAFGQRANALDANIERVVARIFAVSKALPQAKPELRRRAARLLPEEQCGDYLQAMMDLGATICTPRAPKCSACPVRSLCRVAGTARAESLPRKPVKAKRPLRHAIAFLAIAADGAVLLRRRPERGLLGGMMEVPSTPWRARSWTLTAARALAPLKARWRLLPGTVRHVFSHFELEVALAQGRAGTALRQGAWADPARLGDLALPTVMKKILRHGGLSV